MKKITILAIFACAVFIFTSCNKGITCTRTVNGVETSKVKYDKLTRSQKKDIENGGTYTQTNSGTTTTVKTECKK